MASSEISVAIIWLQILSHALTHPSSTRRAPVDLTAYDGRYILRVMTSNSKARRATKPKGFAALLKTNPDLVKRIAVQGGRALSKQRGAKYMKSLGRRGGLASGESKREARQERRLNRIERLALSHA